MTGIDITVHASFLLHDDPEASMALYRDVLGFDVRSDFGQGTMRWITVGPPDRPDTSILLAPPAADPGITGAEQRSIAEVMAKGTYGWILLATSDLDGAFALIQAGDVEVVQEAIDQPYGVRRLRRPRSGGQPDSHPGAALSRLAIAPEVTRLGLARRTEVLRDG